MNTPHLLFGLMLMLMLSGCSTDGFLIDQYEPKFSANPFLTDGYCQDLWGRMIGENSAVIFTGRFGLYTEDGFKTYYYNSFGEERGGVPCFGETMFFDGENAWTLYSAGALSWKLALGTTSASQAKSIESYDLRGKHESLEFANIQPPTVLGLNAMIFTAYRDGILKVCTFIDDEVILLAEIETNLIPVKIFYTNDRFFLLAKKEVFPGPVVESYVFGSEDATNWSGPFLVTGNGHISSIKKSQDLTVAMDKDNVYVSNNNGESWSTINLPLQGEVQDIDVLNGNIIYVVICHQKDESFGCISRLVKSTDNGNNWQLMNNEFYGESISFFNEQHGIAMSKGVLQVTHDGGNNWKLILISNAVK